jgi:hypothetical protein
MHIYHYFIREFIVFYFVNQIICVLDLYIKLIFYLVLDLCPRVSDL